MRPARFLAVCALGAGLALAAAPAWPQSEPELRLPEKLDQALRDMMERMKPTLDKLFESLDSLDRIDGLENYELPKLLPNGDIIIRRRDGAPPWPPPEPPQPEAPGIRT